jgi:hypothetical protein
MNPEQSLSPADLTEITTAPEAPPEFAATRIDFRTGQAIMTLDEVPLQKSPGRNNGAPFGVLSLVPPSWEVVVVEGPRTVSSVPWWQVRADFTDGRQVQGWAAQTAPDGGAVLREIRPDLMLDVFPVDGVPPATGKFQVGQSVYTTTFLNVRTSPGYVGKDESDVVDEAPHGVLATILEGPQPADGLTWWRVRYLSSGATRDGWVAEANASGKAYLSTTQPPPPVSPTPVPSRTFRISDLVYNAFNDTVNLRRTPGYSGKGDEDIVVKLPMGASLTIIGGPQTADLLTWWQVKGAVAGQAVQGWMAEIGAKGERLIVPWQLKDHIRLGKPFAGKYKVTQLFADRPEFYKVFSYDGVPLRGHNGVDFGTPTGVDILATDDGEVVQVGYEAKGFGNFVKLKHTWGESLYAHMKSVTVKEETKVARGDVLGPADNTGNSSGPHLHFGVRILPYKRGDGWGGCCDPVPFMDSADVIIPDSIRGGPKGTPPGMAPDEPGRERP